MTDMKWKRSKCMTNTAASKGEKVATKDNRLCQYATLLPTCVPSLA